MIEGDFSMGLHVSLVFVLVLRSCSVNRSAMIDARDALMQRSSRESENLGQISVDFGRQMLRIAITYLHMSYIRVDKVYGYPHDLRVYFPMACRAAADAP